jgi:hypothetical protein
LYGIVKTKLRKYSVEGKELPECPICFQKGWKFVELALVKIEKNNEKLEK